VRDPVLDDDARSAAEAELALAEEARLSRQRGRLLEAEAAARWSRRRSSASSRARGRRAEHAVAEQAVDDAVADRQELALRHRAEKLRGLWESAARLDRGLALARRDASAAHEVASRASGARAAITERRNLLGELYEPIRAGRIAAGLVERAPRGGPSLGWRARSMTRRGSPPKPSWRRARTWNDVDARLRARVTTRSPRSIAPRRAPTPGAPWRGASES
jgi:hypothetical protein